MKLFNRLIFLWILTCSLLAYSQENPPQNEILDIVNRIKAESSNGDSYRLSLQRRRMMPLLGQLSEDPCEMRKFLHQVATESDPRSLEILRHAVGYLDQKWSTQLRLFEFGLPLDNPNDGPTGEPIAEDSPLGMWGGSGITGVYPGDRETIPLADKINLLRGDVQTRGKYDDVLIRRPGHLTGRPDYSKSDFITSFLNQPAATREKDAYCGQVPDRGTLIRMAACQNGIHPNILAGFLLAEQQDQTANEDRADFQGGRGILGFGSNTSIGIAQIQMSNAMASSGNVFSDLVPDYLPRAKRANTAEMLASDEYAIFAAARFIRNLANSGAEIWDSPELAETRARFPDVSADRLRGNRWNAQTVVLLGSEYTSTPWDNNIHPIWGGVVYQMGVNSMRTQSSLSGEGRNCNSQPLTNLNDSYQRAYPPPASGNEI